MLFPTNPSKVASVTIVPNARHRQPQTPFPRIPHHNPADPPPDLLLVVILRSHRAEHSRARPLKLTQQALPTKAVPIHPLSAFHDAVRPRSAKTEHVDPEL
jgi:hypothetical protein